MIDLGTVGLSTAATLVVITAIVGFGRDFLFEWLLHGARRKDSRSQAALKIVTDQALADRTSFHRLREIRTQAYIAEAVPVISQTYGKLNRMCELGHAYLLRPPGDPTGLAALGLGLGGPAQVDLAASRRSNNRRLALDAVNDASSYFYDHALYFEEGAIKEIDVLIGLLRVMVNLHEPKAMELLHEQRPDEVQKLQRIWNTSIAPVLPQLRSMIANDWRGEAEAPDLTGRIATGPE